MHKLNSRLMLAAVLSAALVAGCGGDGSAAPPIVAPVVTPTPSPTPTPVADISTSISDLFAFISALIAGTSDSTDPIDINALTLATDNAAAPTPLN